MYELALFSFSSWVIWVVVQVEILLMSPLNGSDDPGTGRDLEINLVMYLFRRESRSWGTAGHFALRRLMVCPAKSFSSPVVKFMPGRNWGMWSENRASMGIFSEKWTKLEIYIAIWSMKRWCEKQLIRLTNLRRRWRHSWRMLNESAPPKIQQTLSSWNEN